MKPQRIAEAGFRFCGFGSCIGIKSSCSESKPCQLKFGVWISDKKMFRSSQLLTASHSAIYTRTFSAFALAYKTIAQSNRLYVNVSFAISKRYRSPK